jgi:hypothetical protein
MWYHTDTGHIDTMPRRWTAAQCGAQVRMNDFHGDVTIVLAIAGQKDGGHYMRWLVRR